MKKQNVSIIGVGLLGGSLALALKKRGARLVGWNHRAASRRKAAKILPVALSFEKAVQGADVIVLCSHTGNVVTALRELRPLLGPRTLVMDVSSVKGEVVRQAARVPGMKNHFVPCHPMAGKEKSGVLHADAALYKGRFVFLTPLPGSPKSLVGRAVSFWKNVGATPVIWNAAEHDHHVALTSHLPHLLACALMDVYGQRQKRQPQLSKAVGSGFRDFTRIAGGNPAMWSDIMRMNSVEIRRFLFLYRQHLSQLEKNLKQGNRGYWISFFEKTRELREKL